jgi:hypothetical protein
MSHKTMFSLVVIGKTELNPIDSVTNEGSGACKQEDWKDILLNICRILARGRIELFGGWLLSVH